MVHLYVFATIASWFVFGYWNAWLLQIAVVVATGLWIIREPIMVFLRRVWQWGMDGRNDTPLDYLLHPSKFKGFWKLPPDPKITRQERAREQALLQSAMSAKPLPVIEAQEFLDANIYDAAVSHNALRDSLTPYVEGLRSNEPGTAYHRYCKDMIMKIELEMQALRAVKQ